MESLQNICLDSIILSHDPEIINTVYKLPPFMIHLIDERDHEILDSEKYKKRFTEINYEYSDSDYSEEEGYDLRSNYDSSSDGEDDEEEAWFDPDFESW